MEVYRISGWLPEYLDLNTIDDYDDLWSRIFENFKEGNTIFFLQHYYEEEIFPILGFSDTDSQNKGTRSLKLLNLDSNLMTE